MKPKKPIFTYIITFLNPLVPPFLTTFFLAILVLAREQETGEAITWIDVHFHSMVLGSLILVALSLVYFQQIKTGRLKPIWWRNLVLILAGYLVLPLMGLLMGMEDADSQGNFSIVSVTANLNLIYIIWFIVLAVRKPKPKQPRFKSPFWIAGFAVAHYLLFFISLMSMSMALNMGLNGTAWWWHELNGFLCLPFFTDLTKDLITQNLPGPKAHLVFILNGLLFGALLWVWFRFRNKKLLSATPDVEVSEPNTVASEDTSSI